MRVPLLLERRSMRRPSDQERDLGRRRKNRPRRLETCPKQALATASSVPISGSMTAAICGLLRPWPKCHHWVPLQVPVRERPPSRLGLGACGSVASWCGLPAPVAPVCPPSQGCARFCVVHWMPPSLPFCHPAPLPSDTTPPSADWYSLSCSSLSASVLLFFSRSAELVPAQTAPTHPALCSMFFIESLKAQPHCTLASYSLFPLPPCPSLSISIDLSPFLPLRLSPAIMPLPVWEHTPTLGETCCPEGQLKIRTH